MIRQIAGTIRQLAICLSVPLMVTRTCCPRLFLSRNASPAAGETPALRSISCCGRDARVPGLLLLTLLAVFFGSARMTFARQPAQVRMVCDSLRFHTGTSSVGGQQYTLELTTADNFAEINGEVAPLNDPNAPTHGALFRMHDPNSPDPVTGQIQFDQLAPSDANNNGFDDFFEVSQPASGTSNGRFSTAVDTGTVTVTWSRAAGSATGTCRLSLKSSTFGQLPEFTHVFELLEFAGPLEYTLSTNKITGTLNLVQTGAPASTLTGAVTLTRVSTNRFNELMLSAGSLTTANGSSLSYDVAPIERDEIAKTNYFGFLGFADGDLSTSTADYTEWVLSIDDPNDANANGIPDLSDDPAPAPALRPHLAITHRQQQLLLTVSGDIGAKYLLEQTASIVPANWTAGASIVLTNDPQTVELSAPLSSPVFWRLRQQ